jgi:hypothetical protein
MLSRIKEEVSALPNSYFGLKDQMLSAFADNTRTDKNTSHSYLDLYQFLLSSRKEFSMNVLEIGIDKGGSIKMWHDYFPNAIIHAIDILSINDIWSELQNKPRIQLYTSRNAYDPDFVKTNFIDKSIKCEIILDDGPHTIDSMIQFIKLYSQILTDNGILIIENVQSMDWLPYLEAAVPENLKKYVRVHDLRHLKNQYDDIMFTINKTNTTDFKEVFNNNNSPFKKENIPKPITISFLVMSSFDTLCLECNKITRRQCNLYGMPVLFLFNGRIPDGYQLKPDEHVLETDSTEAKPYMFLKFKYALQNLYKSGSNPDYVLRCNATTFINVKGLSGLFSRLPKEKLMAGPFIYATANSDLDVYCQGTNIVFSGDVAKRIAFDDNINHPAITTYADDIALDILTRDYAYKQDLSLFTARYTHIRKLPGLYDLLIDAPHVFFRVKNDCPQRTEIDIEIWKILHYLFDVIHFRNDYILWGKNQYEKPPL